tara:strand:- start:780 stop:1466 length:687 start_codon:yes stop_codon:yes gene_type:complete
MNTIAVEFTHLLNNLERISPNNSIFNNKSGQKAFQAGNQGDFNEWIETLLPNTRIIIEPKIIGSIIGIQYINGKLNKAINQNSFDITNIVQHIKSIPKYLPINNRIEISGVLYHDQHINNKKNLIGLLKIKKADNKIKRLNFCAFQIFHCKINHFQALKELKNLNFKIPQTQFTNFTSDVEIYRQCWREGKLFQSYPTKGIVLKVNSRKLQKLLGENNLLANWFYYIN